MQQSSTFVGLANAVSDERNWLSSRLIDGEFALAMPILSPDPELL